MILKFYPRTSPPLMSQFGDSFLNQHGLIAPALLVFSALIILHLVLNFGRVQREIPGNKYKKGLVYGAWFGLVWIWGFIEYHHFFGSSMHYGLWAGIGDFVPFLLFGGLIGILFGDSSQQPEKPKYRYSDMIGLCLIPLCFACGRYLLYRFTSIQIRPMNVTGFFCEIGIGATIGLFWYYFRGVFRSPGKGITLKQELNFIVIFWGVNWTLFNLFPLIKKSFPLDEIGKMLLSDVLMLTLGICLYKLLITRKSARLAEIVRYRPFSAE